MSACLKQKPIIFPKDSVRIGVMEVLWRKLTFKEGEVRVWGPAGSLVYLHRDESLSPCVSEIISLYHASWDGQTSANGLEKKITKLHAALGY